MHVGDLAVSRGIKYDRASVLSGGRVVAVKWA